MGWYCIDQVNLEKVVRNTDKIVNYCRFFCCYNDH